MRKTTNKLLSTLLSLSILATSCSSTQIENLDSLQVNMQPTVQEDVQDFLEQEVFQFENVDILASQSRDILSIIELIEQENEASKLEDIPIRDVDQSVTNTNNQTTNSNSNNVETPKVEEEVVPEVEEEVIPEVEEEVVPEVEEEVVPEVEEEVLPEVEEEVVPEVEEEVVPEVEEEVVPEVEEEVIPEVEEEVVPEVEEEVVPEVSSSTSSTTSTTTQQNAVNHNSMRGVWISFLEFQSFAGSSQSAFTSKVSGYFDTCVNKGLNTVIVQVRPHGDSIYPSQYYPWSKSVTGTMGVGLSYDPLEIMISEAKKRGLSFHAWVNPYRTMTDAEMALIDDSYQVKQWYNSSNRSNYMVQVGTDARWWLKPSSAEARQLIVNGVSEIVRNYNVDGIHFDDYFYGADPSVYGDTTTHAKQYNSQMVKQTYDAIKSINSTVEFGISPLGSFNADSSLPTSDTGYLATDLKLWCQTSGYIDYVMPQIYWQYGHSTQPFTRVFDKWQNFVTSSTVDLYIGLAPYKPEVEVESQIKDIENSYNGDGYCLYRYDFIHNLNL